MEVETKQKVIKWSLHLFIIAMLAWTTFEVMNAETDKQMIGWTTADMAVMFVFIIIAKRYNDSLY